MSNTCILVSYISSIIFTLKTIIVKEKFGISRKKVKKKLQKKWKLEKNRGKLELTH